MRFFVRQKVQLQKFWERPEGGWFSARQFTQYHSGTRKRGAVPHPLRTKRLYASPKVCEFFTSRLGHQCVRRFCRAEHNVFTSPLLQDSPHEFMITTASTERGTPALNSLRECELCARPNPVASMHCIGCGSEFFKVLPNDTTKGQRIQNFSAWQQGSVRAHRASTAAAEIPTTRWLYWLVGSALATACIVMLLFLLSRLRA